MWEATGKSMVGKSPYPEKPSPWILWGSAKTAPRTHISYQKKTSKVNLKSVGHKISEALTPWKTKKLRALDKMLISWPHLNGGCPTTGYNQHPLLNRHRPHQSSSRFRTKTICYELHYIPDIAFTSALLTRIPLLVYLPTFTHAKSIHCRI
jgi:hypothetical protein